MHQPGEVLGRTVGGVGRQPLRPQAEALLRAVDHPLLRRHLGLADRGGRLDIDDDGALQVDQVVRALGEEGEPAVRPGPARGRDRPARRTSARPALQHRTRHRREPPDTPARLVRRLGGLPLAPGTQRCRLASALIMLASTANPSPPTRPLGDAALYGLLEHLAQQIAVAETAVPVLGKGRMVGHRAVEPKPAEPAVGRGSDELPRTALAPSECRSSSRRSASGSSAPGRSRAAPPRCRMAPLAPHPVEVDKPVDRSQQMLRRHMPLKRKLVKQGVLPAPTFPHHRLYSAPRQLPTFSTQSADSGHSRTDQTARLDPSRTNDAKYYVFPGARWGLTDRLRAVRVALSSRYRLLHYSRLHGVLLPYHYPGAAASHRPGR